MITFHIEIRGEKCIQYHVLMNISFLMLLITRSICVNFQRKAMVYSCDESAGGSKYHEKMIEELNSLFQGVPSLTLPRINFFLPINHLAVSMSVLLYTWFGNELM